MDLFIANGVVIDPARDVRTKVNCIVRNGKVAAFTASRRAPDGCTLIDAKGAVVAPGFVDMHVHFRDPGQEYKEDLLSGVAAAAAGGFTSVVCLANTDPVNDNAAVTRYILERAAQGVGVRVYPVGAISRGLQGKELADIGDLAQAGCVAISDDGRTVQNTLLMRRAMEYANDFDLRVIVHCEDPFLSQDTVMHEGAVSTRLGLRGRPSFSEELIVRRDLGLARLTGAHVHIQHVSAAESVEAVRDAKRARVRASAEATPHHLLLTDTHLEHFDPVYKVNPPLRTESDRAALRRGLRDGTIDALATDHAPHSTLEKEEMPIETAACGVIGLECALAVSLRLVEEKVISLPRFVELWTAGPARALGLPRGRLAVGDDADVVIFDPIASVTIRKETFRSKSRNCPFDGWRCHGKVLYTIVAGRVIYAG